MIGFFVFNEMEEDPADQVDIGTILPYKFLDRTRMPPDLPSELGKEPLPQVVQNRYAQILGPGHQRRGHQRVVPFFFGERNGNFLPEDFEVGSVAQLLRKEAAESAEKCKGGRKRHARAAESEKKKRAVRIFRKASEEFPFEQFPALVYPFFRLLPLNPDRTDGHDDCLQFPVHDTPHCSVNI